MALDIHITHPINTCKFRFINQSITLNDIIMHQSQKLTGRQPSLLQTTRNLQKIRNNN